MQKCPWCGRWAPQESFIVLQLPPSPHPQIVPIYKDAGRNGCKKLFSIAEYR